MSHVWFDLAFEWHKIKKNVELQKQIIQRPKIIFITRVVYVIIKSSFYGFGNEEVNYFCVWYWNSKIAVQPFDPINVFTVAECDFYIPEEGNK